MFFCTLTPDLLTFTINKNTKNDLTVKFTLGFENHILKNNSVEKHYKTRTNDERKRI